MNSDHLKTYEDLKAYIDQSCEDKCSLWKTACSYNNTTKRWDEQLMVDGMINNYNYVIIPLLVQNNDLDDKYVTQAREYFDKKMEQCGWSYTRANWPGYDDVGK